MHQFSVDVWLEALLHVWTQADDLAMPGQFAERIASTLSDPKAELDPKTIELLRLVAKHLEESRPN